MKHWIDRVLSSFYKTLLAVFCLSLVLHLLIECLSRHSFLEGLAFVYSNPFLFIIGTLIILATLLFVFFFRRRSFAIAVIGGLWLIIGLIEWFVTGYREMPFTAMDILKVTSVMGVTFKYFQIWQVLGIGLLIVVSIAGLVFFFLHSKKRPVKADLKKSIPAFAGCVLIFLAMYFGGRAGGLIPKKLPNVLRATEQYGYVFSFSSSVVRRGVFEPEEYTPKTAIEILENLNERAEETGNERPNIIFIQLESFFDPTYLKDVTYSADPIPIYHSLRERGISGLLTVPTLGAGTVNTEFEILTGMSLQYFGVGEYPFKTTMPDETAESIAYNLGTLGYTSHMIHNNDGDFYDRDEIYAHLGFDAFTSIEFMQNVEFNTAGTWPRDSILTGEIFSALRETPGSDFIMTVTVQSHGKYPPNTMPEGHDYPIDAEMTSGIDTAQQSTDDDALNMEGLVYYVNELADVDVFLGQLYQELQRFDEKTILVLYGDHLPALGITNEDLMYGDVLTTEYVIVSNYGMEKAYRMHWMNETQQHKRHGESYISSVTGAKSTLGDISAYQLYALTLDLCDIHEGILVRLHQLCRFEHTYESWLNILECDMLGDNSDGSYRNVYGGQAYYWPVKEMVFGPDTMTVTSVEIDGDYLLVHGTGFTPYCKIMEEDEELDDTEFVDPTLLRFELQEGLFGEDADSLELSKIQVGVITSAGKILRLIPQLIPQAESE